ncbi:MAG: hypothetical protein DDT28_01170 [Dehalococcoidia bacterium]|nr:hypothetical protein [Chloroflexota bacterium]
MAKALVGLLQRSLKINIEPAGSISQCKDKVTEFVHLLLMGFGSLQFLYLLVYLFQHPFNFLPIEAHAGGTLLDYLAGGQGRDIRGYAIQKRFLAPPFLPPL